MRIVGLFAGIGGFERGFSVTGSQTELLCEIDLAAQIVLRRDFPEVPVLGDVRQLRSLPRCDAVVGGFPCQDLSLVGPNVGIKGARSGLVKEVFRLVENRRSSPRWLVLENVPFMLWHRRGEAIRFVTRVLSDLGFRWAYRVVDVRCFGLPQRRRRVIILASRTEDPRAVLFSDDAGAGEPLDDGRVPCGFSWTEGRLGLGWAVDAVPTLKGGSALGIPSPPAVWWRQSGRIVTPDIRDAERLQGFPVDCTAHDFPHLGRRSPLGARWKMIGNAIPVPLAEWVGRRLREPGEVARSVAMSTWTGHVWPDSACNIDGKIQKVTVSDWPVRRKWVGLEGFLKYPTSELSERACTGFLQRARNGRLKFAPGFLEAVALQAGGGRARAKKVPARAG